MNRRWEDDKKQMKKASYPSQLATFFAGGREGYEGKKNFKRSYKTCSLAIYQALANIISTLIFPLQTSRTGRDGR